MANCGKSLRSYSKLTATRACGMRDRLFSQIMDIRGSIQRCHTRLAPLNDRIEQKRSVSAKLLFQKPVGKNQR